MATQKIAMGDITRRIDAANKWFLHSGIQNIGQGQLQGGISSWYDTITGNYPFIYSEITGYGMTTYVYIFEKTGIKEYIERAEMAARYMINTAKDPRGGFLCKYFYKESKFTPDYRCSFDGGIILTGFTNLAKITGKEEYLQESIKLGDWLLDLQQRNGKMYARYIGNDKVDIPGHWSTQGGSYHAKLSIGLMNLYELTKNEKYKHSVKQLCDFAISMQEEDGRFVTDSENKSTYSHPHCYSIEGLIAASAALEEPKYLEAATKGCKWLFAQMKKGIIPHYYENENFDYFVKSEMHAQAVRTALLINHLNKAEIIPQSRINNAARAFMNLQLMNSNDKQYGGFQYGIDEKGTLKPDVNSWCSMFSLQALYYLQESLENRLITHMQNYV